MNNIIKIVIKGSSGYCIEDEQYNDKVTITKNYIEYEYLPRVITKINPIRNWKYNTNNSIFKYMFNEIAKQISDILEKNIDIIYTDIGKIEFNVTYSNNKKIKKIYFVTGNEFNDLFKTIKSIIPNLEFVPAVLLTDEDFEEE